MGRVHLFELHDQSWFPKPIRDADTDLLRFISEFGNPYGPIIPRLKDALIKTKSQGILDLCSGGGGPIISLREKLGAEGCAVMITLTDKFPNRTAFEYARKRSDGGVDFLVDSVDATAVPSNLSGFRTLFSSLHHFQPQMARSILQDAVDQRCPIGAFEIAERSFRGLMSPLILPLLPLLVMPFIRPFRWSRLFWTYLIPVVPPFIMWDAFVSCLRTYSTRELQTLVNGLGSNDYVWEIGREGGITTITYLIGYPNPMLGRR